MINIETIRECSNREEARVYLNQFKVKELKQLCKDEQIHLPRSNKEFVIECLIDRYIGMRLALNAIASLDLRVKSRS